MTGSPGAGVFLSDGPDLDSFAAAVKDLVGAGYQTVYIETPNPRQELVDAVRDAGAAVVFCIACFSDHLEIAGNNWVRPRFPDGRFKEPLEWYRGISPLDAHREAVVADTVAVAAGLHPDGVVLDFIRWPVHWEWEFRPSWPGDLRAANYGLGAEEMADEINRIAGKLTTIVRAADASLWTGITTVPCVDDRQRGIVGQDLATLAGLASWLMPMMYHAMVGRPAGWTLRYLRDLGIANLCPIFQLTSDPSFSGGADWGTPVATEDLQEMARFDGGSWAVFPGEDLSSARVFQGLNYAAVDL